ncbi:hypothetical protein [Chitinophaga arvensicola]|uniref:Uncharacterized protein n=1 Tax=Chitinophaga arvensicola TaxID=29529 RepID=A0A1I0SCU7_9BACT|nr:hypothetical protein [Chitinophaga arvensicola]SEW54992.1 hypothetical protein SAMN04488122_6272 [Chitinophaga arvensicola]
MKYVLIYCLLLLSYVAEGQEMINYRDTVHHFSLDVPDQWRVIRNDEKNHIIFAAQRTNSGGLHSFPEHVTVNVLPEPNSNVDNVAKKLLFLISRNPYFKLIDSGSIISQGKRLVWLDEIHVEPNRTDTFFSSIFISYADSKTYLLTASTFLPFPDRFKEIFHQIGQSFKTGKAALKERLKITLPANSQWTMITDTEVDNLATRQYLPASETPQQWSLLITNMTMENARVDNIDLAIKNFTNAAISRASQAKTTLLGKENLPKRRWALFKVETPGAGTPESQLYYVVQGPRSFHAVFIAKKSETLPADFVSKWSAVFRNSKVINE